MAEKLNGIMINSSEAVMVHPGGKVYFEQMPVNLVDENGIVSPESLVKFLKDARKKSGISLDRCAFVMPEGTAYYRPINSPVLTDEQIKLNLPYEFRNFVGNDAIKYNYDYFVDHVDRNEVDIPEALHLVAAAGLKETTLAYADVFKRAGMKLKIAIPREVCLINLMKKTAEADKEYCLIGVGYNTTGIYMFKGSELVATKVIEIGNKDIDRIISEEKGTDEFMAANYREQNYENCLGLKELNSIYEKIALDAMKTINFYKYEHSESELNTAYFFDLGCKNEKLINSICERCNLNKGEIAEILPKEFVGVENADRCLINIGLVE